MTTRTIGEWLRVAILGGGVCLISATALAEGDGVPDHAEVQARHGADVRAAALESDERVPDHAQAEARRASPDAVPGPERTGATDHETVQSRGAAAPSTR
jgi:hypothetical protein